MSDYSLLERTLHRLALGFPLLTELSFDLERHCIKPVSEHRDAIYVTGLARAGTTALMRGIYASEQFASLTYDDMPFVLAPNLWEKLSKLHGKRRILQERAHGDGIRIDFDSPEALEEVFWRLHSDGDIINAHTLRIHTIDRQTVRALNDYQRLICHKYGRSRYLAKNNNHILRIASLAEQVKNTKFIILFRDPVSQARSLLQQHRRFQNTDPFTRSYMNWLSHHEFGATHKPFHFVAHTKTQGSFDHLDDWLHCWIGVYRYLLGLLEQGVPNLIPVCYETLCNNVDDWKTLCRLIDIPLSNNPFNRTDHNRCRNKNPLIQQADEIYNALRLIRS